MTCWMHPSRIAWVAGLVFVAAACGTASGTTPRVRPPGQEANPEAVRHFARGTRLMRSQRRTTRQKARAEFEAAIEADPTLWEAYHNLGVWFRQEGDLSAAISNFTKARSASPTAEPPAIGIAEALYTAGEVRRAVGVLEEHLDEVEDSVPVRAALASLQRETGNYKKALEQARAVLVRESSNFGALMEVGRIYRARGKYDVSELVFRKAIEIDEKSPEPHNELGLLSLRRGDTQAAFTHFDEAIAKDPTFVVAIANRAGVFLRSGDYAGAETEYRRILTVDESNLDARVSLGVALRGLGKHKRAASEYRKVLKVRPDHPAALFNLAVLQVEFLNQPSKAKVGFEKYVRVAPPRTTKRAEAQQYLKRIAEEETQDL